MKIKFNVVTWYSKLLAIIFFIAVLPIWTFYIGTKVKEVEMYSNYNNSNAGGMVALLSLKKKESNPPKIDVGQKVLVGQAFGMIRDVFEKDGKLWVDVDPADQVSALECVFRSYDANISGSCDQPDGVGTWNLSTSTIAMPLSAKATLAVYYNDGTKIGLKPKVVTTKNGKLYSYSLLVSTSSSATSYNRVLSYDGDDTYRWNPLMHVNVKNGDAKLGEDPSRSYIDTIEEVWRP